MSLGSFLKLLRKTALKVVYYYKNQYITNFQRPIIHRFFEKMTVFLTNYHYSTKMTHFW